MELGLVLSVSEAGGVQILKYQIWLYWLTSQFSTYSNPLSVKDAEVAIQYSSDDEERMKLPSR